MTGPRCPDTFPATQSRTTLASRRSGSRLMTGVFLLAILAGGPSAATVGQVETPDKSAEEQSADEFPRMLQALLSPRTYSDTRGPLTPANRLVVRFAPGSTVPAFANLPSAGLPGWHVVDADRVADPEVIAAVADAEFMTPGYLDRQGELVWPTGGVFVRTKPGVDRGGRDAMFAASPLAVRITYPPAGRDIRLWTGALCSIGRVTR